VTSLKSGFPITSSLPASCLSWRTSKAQRSSCGARSLRPGLIRDRKKLCGCAFPSPVHYRRRGTLRITGRAR
jgi:hypothetical protein